MTFAGMDQPVRGLSQSPGLSLLSAWPHCAQLVLCLHGAVCGFGVLDGDAVPAPGAAIGDVLLEGTRFGLLQREAKGKPPHGQHIVSISFDLGGYIIATMFAR